eukprot:contig_3817_g838
MSSLCEHYKDKVSFGFTAPGILLATGTIFHHITCDNHKAVLEAVDKKIAKNLKMFAGSTVAMASCAAGFKVVTAGVSTVFVSVPVAGLLAFNASAIHKQAMRRNDIALLIKDQFAHIQYNNAGQPLQSSFCSTCQARGSPYEYRMQSKAMEKQAFRRVYDSVSKKSSRE